MDRLKGLMTGHSLRVCWYDDVGKERGRPIGREDRAKFPLTEVVFQEESINTVAIQEQTEDVQLLHNLQHGRLPQRKAKRKRRFQGL
jgi:hypothetical protein